MNITESIDIINRNISRIKESERFDFEKVHCMVFAYAFSKFLELENVEYSCSFLDSHKELEKRHKIVHVALSFAGGRYLLDINGIREITEEFTAGNLHRIVNTRYKMNDVEILNEEEFLKVSPYVNCIKYHYSSAFEVIKELIGENKIEIKHILEKFSSS